MRFLAACPMCTSLSRAATARAERGARCFFAVSARQAPPPPPAPAPPARIAPCCAHATQQARS
eukprot:3062324-Pleurochrysis_carterae.AAC.2